MLELLKYYSVGGMRYFLFFKNKFFNDKIANNVTPLVLNFSNLSKKKNRWIVSFSGAEAFKIVTKAYI